MASILRQIVAGPRARHPEAGLDLCYVTDFIVATSGPSSTYPKKAYRNPTDQLVKFLDYKHDTEWAIWEFRAEGTGYPDSEVYGRIHHFPWPDHHPPPFAVIPRLMASMRQWLRYEDEDGEGEGSGKKHKKKRIAVVHCKAGKGRSGTVACSYLISQEGWKKEDALQRFTDRRMRVGFGAGVSIPSQLRYVGYVDCWTNQLGKKYVERPVEIVEVHVFGLRDGVKVAIEGYVEEGRRMECFHIFNRAEKTVVSGSSKDRLPRTSSKKSLKGNLSETILSSPQVQSPAASTPSLNEPPVQPHLGSQASDSVASPGTQNVLLRPSEPIILPTSDINIDFERRNAAAGYTGLTLVTSVAHVWFNPYFEGGSDGFDSGVFEIQWDAMDGIKGSARKGVKALERVKVLWRYAKSEAEAGEEGEPRLGKVITEPGKGEPIPEGKPTDWRGAGNAQHDDDTAATTSDMSSGQNAGLLKASTFAASGAEALGKQLGLRKEKPESIDVSRASSIREPERHSSSVEEGDHHEHPYPEPNSHALADEHSKFSDLDDTMSPSPAGFGRGPKAPAVDAAYHDAVTEEKGAYDSTQGGEQKSSDVGRERGHEPVVIKNKDGGHDAVTYEDGESEEEAVAPSNNDSTERKSGKENGKDEDNSSGVGNVGLGKFSGVVNMFKSGGNTS